MVEYADRDPSLKRFNVKLGETHRRMLAWLGKRRGLTKAAVFREALTRMHEAERADMIRQAERGGMAAGRFFRDQGS